MCSYRMLIISSYSLFEIHFCNN